ncbi:MAG: hypothetical protein ACYDCK_07830 [Thermoplasmatota archaeon]
MRLNLVLVCAASIAFLTLPPAVEAKQGQPPPTCYYTCNSPAIPELCSAAGVCEPCPALPAVPGEGLLPTLPAALPCEPPCAPTTGLPACPGSGGEGGDP